MNTRPIKMLRAGGKPFRADLAREFPLPLSLLALALLGWTVPAASLRAQNGLAIRADSGSSSPGPSLREYRETALNHDGNLIRGKELFSDEQRVACVKCHSVDGSSAKAGPDLYAI